MPLARAIVLNIIKSMVPLNLPGSQIISVLQHLNVAYRRTEMLNDIRLASGRIKYETQVTGLSSNQVVPEAWMSKEVLGKPYTYKVHFKVDYYDTDTKEYTSEDRYMFSDDKKSVGDYASDLPDYADSKGYETTKEYMGIKVIGVTKNMTPGEVPI